ncbi:MAG: excinuclease ABC subunit UvrA, partial [Proteobacteria bacterium]|nr:excinuclease ABC subunit UvrA [Pseudomonadota bacterium]
MDTIYKEGQRRFLESLSAYARQFLGGMQRPQVELVEGISPTLAIDQKTVNRNPRSTVGTITEIYDFLRLLMARLGTPHCPQCGTEVVHLAMDQLVDRVIEQGLNQRLQILGPVVQDRKGEYRKELADLARDGWVRARIDGQMVTLGEDIVELARYEKHRIEVVVDRLKVNAAQRGRVAESLETALTLGNGVVVLLLDDKELTFAQHRACPHHPEISIPEVEPRLFSFNAPQGACPVCKGMGRLTGFDPELLVDLSRPAKDCYRAFNDEGRLPFAHFNRQTLAKVVKLLGAPARAKVGNWPPELRQRLLYGDEAVRYRIKVQHGSRREVRERPWRGLVNLVEQIYKYTSHAPLEKFRIEQPCPECGGTRLNAVSRAVRFRQLNIVDVATMTIADAYRFFQNLRLDEAEEDIGQPLVAEVLDRLSFLMQVGLPYLTLDRTAVTLSGGEAQRIRLAAQVGSALQGVTYVLDEPSVGLHVRDNRRLLEAMRKLRDRGNTVLVVEHDTDTILAADYVIDIGPGAGQAGGQVVATGPPRKIRDCQSSLTGAYLRGDREIPLPTRRRQHKSSLTLCGASRH